MTEAAVKMDPIRETKSEENSPGKCCSGDCITPINRYYSYQLFHYHNWLLLSVFYGSLQGKNQFFTKQSLAVSSDHPYSRTFSPRNSDSRSEFDPVFLYAIAVKDSSDAEGDLRWLPTEKGRGSTAMLELRRNVKHKSRSRKYFAFNVRPISNSFLSKIQSFGMKWELWISAPRKDISQSVKQFDIYYKRA